MSDQRQIDRARGTVKLAAAIALKGGQQSLLTFHAPWTPACDNPKFVYRSVNRTKGLRSVECSMLVPCRRCPRCLQIRQMKWRERALVEIQRANRTWMLTLTFSPTQLAGVLVSASSAEPVQVERRAYADVQRYAKRLRKHGAKFRYLAIFERGETSGRAHYHMLLHETGRYPILKAVLEDTWPSHVHARLVREETPGAASYTTKYLTKAFDVRPRASFAYGNTETTTAKPKGSEASLSAKPAAHFNESSLQLPRKEERM